jgi:RNA polymerase sigma-70 factor (ECF subfamily)
LGKREYIFYPVHRLISCLFHDFVAGKTGGVATVWLLDRHQLMVGQMPEIGCGAIDWTAELEQHDAWLRRVLRGRIGNRHEVDDLMQEIALAVCRQKSLPEDPLRVAPWLYRLAVRQAINFHRRKGRKSNARPEANLEVSSGEDEPLDWLLSLESTNVMREAIAELGIRDREILMLKYTENWSYRQLAQHLGIKEKTVEYRLMKARQRLRALILSRVGTP